METPHAGSTAARVGRWVCTPAGLLLTVAIGAVLAYLIVEHRLHVVAALPYLVLLACPVLHFFHHRGHGHRGHGPQERPPHD